jgi:hypothetical protein
MKSGSWGASITVPIEGVPVTLGANASNDEYSKFKQKITSDKNFSINKDYLSVLINDVPNTDLAQIYSDCVNPRTGFSITSVSTDNSVSFIINYLPLDLTDALPTVQSFSIVSGTTQLDNSNIVNNLLKGQQLNKQTAVTAIRDPKKELIISLQTNKGSIVRKISAESLESNSESPVGSIICSFLDFDQFNLLTRNNELGAGNLWTSAKSKWSPADGRPVPKSRYETISSQSNVPDLRGLFLRGLNQFDYREQTVVKPERMNPDQLKVGDFQGDAFIEHTHDIANALGPFGSLTAGSNIGQGDTRTSGELNKNAIKPAGVGNKETRPKNISVYYYIRIN